MAHTLTTVQLTPEELRALIREAVRDELQHSPPTPRKRYLDSGELASHFGVSRQTVHKWIHEDGCPHIGRGKVLRFELAAVEQWFRGRGAAGLKRVK